MALTLYYHPLSSFCMKVLTALYENETPFTPLLIDLSKAESRAQLTALWPLGKFPVLRDDARDWTVPEASIIIEYLAQHYPGRERLVPADPDLARQVRMRDRFFDLYVNQTMQSIVDQLLRAPEKRDADAIAAAQRKLAVAYDMIEAWMKDRDWAMGDAFTMADCAAAPALLYANAAMPLGAARKHASGYLDRLLARPSFARAVQESQPYTHLLPILEGYRVAYGARFSRRESDGEK